MTALLANGSLDEGEILINCDNVLIGGNETTRYAVTGCFHALARNPEMIPALRADPALVPAAVEEILRWVSPAMHVLRVSTDPMVIAGQEIDEGVAVVALAARGEPGSPRLSRPG